MIGKKNIVFGFLYLVLTAALGPYMVKGIFPELEKAGSARQEQMAQLQLMAGSDFEQDLEPLAAGDIARRNTTALLALNGQLQTLDRLDSIKGGPHAHGNLEALLNIAAGLVLCFLALGRGFKQLLSWAFLLGALLHSGMLYLGIVFEQSWAMQLLGLGIGPILLLVALLLTGAGAAIGFRGELVRDD
ncbi:MAG TPA: hypothetical protein ENK05_00900 [Gammaproteobacteria bacterium]|nr:hypothetical protein [Gammaproteobacteria bacterium]